MKIEAFRCGRTNIHLRRAAYEGAQPYVLCCTPAEFADLIERVKAGEFDDLVASVAADLPAGA